MLCLQQQRRLRQQKTVALGFDMRQLRRLQWTQQRSSTPRINRNFKMPGQFADPARITLGLRQRQISGDGDNAEDLQFVRRR